MFATLKRAAVVALALLVIVPAARAAEGDEHLFLGNPSGASHNRKKPDNYLVKKKQYALSYNNSKGTPNWVSWQLSKKWLGRTRRRNAFAPDTSLAGFFQVRPNDYPGSPYDRGHMCPAADRSVSRQDMDATFLMTNMVPQAQKLNRGTWQKLEEYCYGQASDGDEDLYIIAGPAGKRSVLRRAKGNIIVPARCWKVVLVVPAGTKDPRKLTAKTARVFAAIFPNTQGVGTDWRDYAVPVADVEKLTGYTFFTSLPRAVAEDLRTRKPQTRAKAEKPRPKKGTKKDSKDLELPAFVEGCVVGNRSTQNYHVAGGRGYERAKKSKNAVFFRSEADAKKAGYEAAKR
jgi:endonuclease G